MDIAALGFSVDSGPLKAANDELGKMPAKASAAERAAQRWGDATSRAAKQVVDNVAESAKSWTTAAGLANMASQSVANLAVRIGTVLGAAIGGSTLSALSFANAMAEVSTLVDTVTFDLQGLSKEAINQAKLYGSSPAQQAKAFYQIISAGASSAAEATDILTTSNKLAVGGVTDVRTAADGLTSVLNAYGSKVESSTAVSDALFVAMRAGKTTIGELASSLGKVAPIAAQIGVTFDQLAAAVSALTKGGIQTTEAVTGVRAVLAAVAKPAEEAVKAAKQLGLDFTTTALASKGFQGFLDDVVKKTGGSTDALAKLFGGVEALVPIMALSGQAGVDFNNIMQDMAKKAGSTKDAFDKMADSPGFQAARLWGGIQAEFTKAGLDFVPALTNALRVAADNLSNVTSAAKVAGTTLAVAFAPAVFSGIVYGFGAMTAAALAGLNAIRIAIMTNPIGLLAVAFTTVAVAAYEFRDKINSILGVDLFGIVKDVVNFVINSFEAAYEDVVLMWKKLPGALGDFMYSAANSVIEGIESMINAIAKRIDWLTEKLNALNPFGKGRDLGKIGEIKLGRVDNPYAGKGDELLKEREAMLKRIYAQDRVGQLLGDGNASKQFPDAPPKPGAPKLPGVTVPGDGKAGESFKKITDEAEAFIAKQNAVRDSLGLTALAAARLKHEVELLAKAKAEGLDKDPAMVASLKALAGQMAEAEVSAEAAKRVYELNQEAKQFVADQELQRQMLGMSAEAAARLKYETELLNKARKDGMELTPEYIQSLKDSAGAMAAAEQATKQATEMYELQKSTFKGFFTDLKTDLLNGKSLWESFGHAAINALQKITDKLMEMALNNVFDSIMGKSGGGGGMMGGLLGGLIGGGGAGATSGGFLDGLFTMFAGSPFMFAKGGVIDGGIKRFANGSIVNGQTIFPMANGLGMAGEAGPEGIFPLTRGPDGSMGVKAWGGKSDAAPQQRVVVDVRLNTPMFYAEVAKTADKRIDTKSPEIEQRAVKTANSQVPSVMNNHHEYSAGGDWRDGEN